MKENCLKKNNIGSFLALAAFFFLRTALFSPVQCFLMQSDYPYFRFSVESVVFIALLLIFSAVSAGLVFSFRNKAGDIAAVVCTLALSDPLFFGTQNTPLKLFVDILILLLVLNAISAKKLVATGILFPVVLFVSTILIPYSIIGYIPTMVSIYMFAGRKSDKVNRYGSTLLVGMAFAVAGFVLNKILVDEVQAFNEFLNTFSFADVVETQKRFRIVAALIPVAVFAPVFIRQYKKTERSLSKKKHMKKQESETVLDALFLPVILSVGSMIFLNAEAFCAVNLILPSIILTSICHKDEICIRTMNSISDYIKEHKILSVIMLMIVFAIAAMGAVDYVATRQLLFYVIY